MGDGKWQRRLGWRRHGEGGVRKDKMVISKVCKGLRTEPEMCGVPRPGFCAFLSESWGITSRMCGVVVLPSGSRPPPISYSQASREGRTRCPGEPPVAEARDHAAHPTETTTELRMAASSRCRVTGGKPPTCAESLHPGSMEPGLKPQVSDHQLCGLAKVT